MSKVLVDTNMLVYAIDQDSAYFSKSRNFLESPDNELYTTSKNLSEFLTVVTRPSGYELETDLALEILDEIIEGVSILYPNNESLAVFLELVGRYKPSGLNLHDFEIISIGLANGIGELATFNTADFKPVKKVTLSDL